VPVASAVFLEALSPQDETVSTPVSYGMVCGRSCAPRDQPDLEWKVFYS
jgi:hypothetical protein